MANTYNPAKDPYAQRSVAVDSYARMAMAVTTNDAADLPTYAKALWIGGAGNVVVIPMNAVDDANTVTFTAVPAGTLLPVQVRRVLNTGTTATLIVGLSA